MLKKPYASVACCVMFKATAMANFINLFFVLYCLAINLQKLDTFYAPPLILSYIYT